MPARVKTPQALQPTLHENGWILLSRLIACFFLNYISNVY
jgi:hypothetical protein